MGSPTSTRRRRVSNRNSGTTGDECISPSNSDSLFLLSASSDSETSESRRSSSRDLSSYANQLKYRHDRDSSEERDPSSGPGSNGTTGSNSNRGRQNQTSRSSNNKVNNGQQQRHVQAPNDQSTKYADQSIDNIPEVIVTPPSSSETTTTTTTQTTKKRRKKKKKDFESISDKRYQFVLCQ